MHGALFCYQKTGAHLHTARAERKGGDHAPAIRDSARGDDGDLHRVYHLRHERHGRKVAHVPAALAALGDHRVNARALDDLRQRRGRHDGKNGDTRLFPHFDETRGIARARGDDGDFFLGDHFRDFFDERAHQHEIDAEGLIRHRFTGAYFAAHPVGVRVHGGNDAEAARVGNGARERRVRDPRHAALDNGVLDMK